MTRGVCVVAGARGIIGGTIVHRVQARFDAVVGVGRTPPDDVEDVGGIEWCTADLHEDATVDRVRAAVLGRPVGMLVQAARPDIPAAPLATVSPRDLARAVDLKVGGLLRLVRAVEPHLQAGSRIIALGGRYGAEPDSQAPAAGVCNAALENLVRQLADDLAPRGVTAHVLAPGRVDSERTPVVGDHVGFTVRPDDVAWAVEALLAPSAGFLTGRVLRLGWPAPGMAPGET